jgi:hypothetical protein
MKVYFMATFHLCIKDHEMLNWPCFHPKGQQKHGGIKYKYQWHCELWVPRWVKILEYWRRHGDSQMLEKMATIMTKQTYNQSEPLPHKSKSPQSIDKINFSP